MRNSSIWNLVSSIVLVFALTVPAAARPQRYIYREDAQTLFNQVRSDLERAQHDAFPRDTDSIERARAELNELEREWDDRVYSPRQADVVVSALERVLSENHLSFRDHSSLSDDLSKMRAFRDRHN